MDSGGGCVATNKNRIGMNGYVFAKLDIKYTFP